MIDKIRKPIFIETALLGQGLPSISNQEMLELWTSNSSSPTYLPDDSIPRMEQQLRNSDDVETHLIWMEKGNLIQGDLTRFLAERMTPGMRRIDGMHLAAAQEKGESGFLTASAVMRLSPPGALTVTAGMGGIRNANQSDDLFCLTTLPVFLVASSPKDVLDLTKTIQYLFRHGTQISGWQNAQCDGFLFHHPPVTVPTLKLSPEVSIRRPNLGCLILNPIPASKRFQDRKLLQKALSAGIEAEKQGESFHPAVNGNLDRLSGGLSSKIQLQALVQNINLANYIRNQLA
jgi:pseudouridine-5'-phosphate glycosidase